MTPEVRQLWLALRRVGVWGHVGSVHIREEDGEVYLELPLSRDSKKLTLRIRDPEMNVSWSSNFDPETNR